MKIKFLLVPISILIMMAACDDDTSGPNDVTSPVRVTTLTVLDAVGADSLLLQWTAPGDDGGAGTATSYQIRRSLNPINAANFGSATVVPNPPAPLAGGSPQQFIVSGIDTTLVTHFALRAVDESGNTSQISNDAEWRYEAVAPAAVADLAVVTAGDNSLTLQWTAPGDDGNTGTATRYEIRHSLNPINAANFNNATEVANPPAPLIAGTVQQFTVTPVDTTATRHFALRAFDELDNPSPVSNDALWTPRGTLVHLIKDIVAAKDNTLFEESDSLSNGQGQYVFTGKTLGLSGSPMLRRALLYFAVADSLPASAVIDSVRLTMRVSKVPNNTARTASLHRLTADWGEGVSDAAEPGGGGAPAETNDATWAYRFYSTVNWTTPGGDFSATASAQRQLAGLGPYTWQSVTMKTDVQSWLNTPATNFGWIVVGDESVQQTAKRLDSSEHPTAVNRPRLRVYYTVTQ